MLDRIAKPTQLAWIALALPLVGCTQLSKPQPAPPQGQTISPEYRLQKTAESLLRTTKRQGSNLVAKVKRVLPGQNRTTALEDVVDSNDPTRLDNMPANVSPDLYVSAARLSEQAGRYEKAFEQYKLALAADGGDRDALIGMARLQHRAGHLDAAIAVYRDALQVYHNDAVMLNDLGLIYARKGQWNEAISALQAATQAAPDRDLYVNNLATCLVEANRLPEAIRQLSRVQGAAKANYHVGYLLSQSGRTQEAETYLHQALAADPSLSQARILLEQSLRRGTQSPLMADSDRSTTK